MEKDDKKLDKRHYRIIIGLMVFAVAYHYFIEPKTIGYDIRYSVFIFWMPITVGIIVLGIYRTQFLINSFKTNKGFFLSFFMVSFYLLQGLIFSYLSFGQVAKISWDYYNYRATQKELEETLYCQITKFWTDRKPSIYFEFDDRTENIRVSYSEVKNYEDEDENDYLLKLKAKKGIWGYYTVKEWYVERK